jgi:hypothetical protein
MASIRRALFPSSPISSIERCANSPSVLSCVEASESSSREKQGDTVESTADFHDVVIEEKTVQ